MTGILITNARVIGSANQVSESDRGMIGLNHEAHKEHEDGI